jgi:hypothetical protein
MEQIGTNIRRKEAVGHSLYPPTCGKSLAARLPQDTTRLSAECKDCGGDEVAGLTRRRVSARSAAGGLVLCDASTREELFVGPRRTSRSGRWPAIDAVRQRRRPARLFGPLQFVDRHVTSCDVVECLLASQSVVLKRTDGFLTRELSPSRRCNARPPQASSSILTSQLSWPRPLNGLQRPQIAHAPAFTPGGRQRPQPARPVVVCRSADNAANERPILPQLHARTTHQGFVTSQRLVSWCHPMASPLLTVLRDAYRAKEGAHDSSHAAVEPAGLAVGRSSGPGEGRRWWRWRRRRWRRRCWCRKLQRRSWRRQRGRSRRRADGRWAGRRADGRCLARSRSRNCDIQSR